MSNRQRSSWKRLLRQRRANRVTSMAHVEASRQASSTIFLIMRRMRAPLITLIVILSVSVVGLSLIPGVDGEGRRAFISLFQAFYFMSFTAATIGFSELPWPFTAGQRLWVIFSIYLSVIGWAYALGSLLSLIQDKSLRHALAMGHFTRKVARMRTPFLLLAGYGRAGELLVKDFDALGQQVVVIDTSQDRIDALDVASFRADVPGLVGDAANPYYLRASGLDHPCCTGVLALTGDDETNLAVTMAAVLTRPDVPVISRTISRATAERMQAFDTVTVVNPFDRFGDHLRLALNAASCYRLLVWLEAGPGAKVPELVQPPVDGHWVVCGYGRFGREVTADLRDAGLDVVVVDGADDVDPAPGLVVGDASDPDILASARVASAVGLMAATDNDTYNLSILASAKRLNPGMFLAARQNRQTSAALFEAIEVDSLMVPNEVIAHEVYAQISTPLLWRFIQEMPGRGDGCASDLVERLMDNCGTRLPSLWRISLQPGEAPALLHWLAEGDVTLGDLLRSPEDRDQQLKVVPLMLLRGDQAMLAPRSSTVLARGDQLLCAGHVAERRELHATLQDDSVAAYVIVNERLPSTWVWRALFGRRR
ncbi:potassium channel family protein [Tessaracoccus antarcticus]|uniref:Potassium transporter TrkA n=1 Tax=Tessaracoccus antarcticus TaxID=2479848 RepID=A0A3M0G5A5_9ACTN|nr:NAD-binding protein [Tessaracoccus antarcticus]RMB60220.1 potassium transporter TrkA [Tessaracoccus antarcticus]